MEKMELHGRKRGSCQSRWRDFGLRPQFFCITPAASCIPASRIDVQIRLRRSVVDCWFPAPEVVRSSRTGVGFFAPADNLCCCMFVIHRNIRLSYIKVWITIYNVVISTEIQFPPPRNADIRETTIKIPNYMKVAIRKIHPTQAALGSRPLNNFQSTHHENKSGWENPTYVSVLLHILG